MGEFAVDVRGVLEPGDGTAVSHGGCHSSHWDQRLGYLGIEGLGPLSIQFVSSFSGPSPLSLQLENWAFSLVTVKDDMFEQTEFCVCSTDSAESQLEGGAGGYGGTG